MRKSNQMQSLGEVWDEQAPGVNHICGMTWFRTNTFCLWKDGAWEFLTTYSRIRGRMIQLPIRNTWETILKWQISKPYFKPAATKTLGDMTLEPVFFSNLLKSILVQLGHYLTMRTSKQCNCFQENNEESYILKKKKILQKTVTQFQRLTGQDHSLDYLLKTCFHVFECSLQKATYLNKLKEIIPFHGKNLWIKDKVGLFFPMKLLCLSFITNGYNGTPTIWLHPK